MNDVHQITVRAIGADNVLEVEQVRSFIVEAAPELESGSDIDSWRASLEKRSISIIALLNGDICAHVQLRNDGSALQVSLPVFKFEADVTPSTQKLVMSQLGTVILSTAQRQGVDAIHAVTLLHYSHGVDFLLDVLDSKPCALIPLIDPKVTLLATARIITSIGFSKDLSGVPMDYHEALHSILGELVEAPTRVMKLSPRTNFKRESIEVSISPTLMLATVMVNDPKQTTIENIKEALRTDYASLIALSAEDSNAQKLTSELLKNGWQIVGCAPMLRETTRVLLSPCELVANRSLPVLRHELNLVSTLLKGAPRTKKRATA